jgi:D-xylose transport system permease protein
MSQRATEQSASGSGTRVRALRGLGHEYRLLVVVLILILIWVFFYTREPLFLSSGNLTNLALQTVVTGVLALGVSFVLLLGEIDLAVGALGGVAAAVMGRLIVSAGWSPWASLAIAILGGAAFGLVQGLFVVLGAPSFMVTLGSSIALGGVLLFTLPNTGSIDLSQSPIAKITITYMTPVTSWTLLVIVVALVGLLKYTGRPLYDSEAPRGAMLRTFAVPLIALVVGAALILYFDRSRGVPLALVIMLSLYALAAYVTSETRFGTSIYAIGDNEQASRRAGFRVVWVKLACFCICGGFAALAGALAAARVLGVSNQSGGSGLVLEAIAAAVIGGISLFGGRGIIWSALLGALIIGSISNGMDLLGMATETKFVVTGVILIVAVSLDAVASRGHLLPTRE